MNNLTLPPNARVFLQYHFFRLPAVIRGVTMQIGQPDKYLLAIDKRDTNFPNSFLPFGPGKVLYDAAPEEIVKR